MSRYSNEPSFWESQSFLANNEYTIVGGGMTGLLTALNIRSKYPESKVLIIERSFLPSGASTKNAGFACFGSLSELLSDLNTTKIETVMALVEKRYRGLRSLNLLLHNSEIGYQENGGYEVFTKEDHKAYQDCHSKMDFLNKEIEKSIGIQNVFSNADDEIEHFGLKDIEHLILNKAEGQLNTGRLMKVLIQKVKDQNVKVFNGIALKSFENIADGVEVELENNWTFKTKKLILTSNAFTKKLEPSLSIKAVRNPVLVSNEIQGLKLKGCFHYKQGYVYFRNIGKRVLIGGGRHLDLEGETTSTFGINPLLEEYLIKMLEDHVLKGLPFEIHQKWSGILGVGDSKSPIVKPIKDNIFVAARMGGMGVAISSLVAEEVVDLIGRN